MLCLHVHVVVPLQLAGLSLLSGTDVLAEHLLSLHLI